MGSKPLHICFEKIDGFSKTCDGIRYLLLFGLESYAIYSRIRYLISENYRYYFLQESELTHIIRYL